MKKQLKTRLAIILICILIGVGVLVFILNNTDLLKEKDTNSDETTSNKLTCKILDESLELGTQFLINNQKSEGNFNYEYDFIKKLINTDDNEVRQAGALWGIALIYNFNQDSRAREAFEKGFNFFKNCSEGDDECKWVAYPSSQVYGRTGTIAVLSLSIIDFLRSAEKISTEFRGELEFYLEKYLHQLISLRLDNGQFYQYYYLNNGTGGGDPSPYFDGESLLAFTKAAKYLDKTEFIPIILDSANKTYHAYVIEALENSLDSDNTKGFFQWGSMSYFEMATTNWNNTNLYSDIVIDLADWMIDVHKTLERTRNTGYAYEGIIHAYELARRNNDTNHSKKFASVIDKGLYKLTTWQVGGSVQNIFLRNHSTTDKLAVGGVMNHKEEPYLRIDVTQHQMHAVILANKYVYNCE